MSKNNRFPNQYDPTQGDDYNTPQYQKPNTQGGANNCATNCASNCTTNCANNCATNCATQDDEQKQQSQQYAEDCTSVQNCQ
jgi:hypothetical protein